MLISQALVFRARDEGSHVTDYLLAPHPRPQGSLPDCELASQAHSRPRLRPRAPCLPSRSELKRKEPQSRHNQERPEHRRAGGSRERRTAQDARGPWARAAADCASLSRWPSEAADSTGRRSQGQRSTRWRERPLQVQAGKRRGAPKEAPEVSRQSCPICPLAPMHRAGEIPPCDPFAAF